jgi:xylulokinase
MIVGRFLSDCRGPHSQVTSPTLMWVEALDLILHRLQEASFPFQQVVAVSGSGQQHGSVYWANGARSKLRSLKSSESLHTQLKDAFATPGKGIDAVGWLVRIIA